MKTVIEEQTINMELPKVLDTYFHNMKIGVFDIETLGLNPDFTELILSGIVEIANIENVYGQNRIAVTVTQYFCENPAEEADVIKKTVEHLNRFDYLLTFNGKHFDLPFINARIKKHGLDGLKPNLFNLDLYLVINGHSPFKKLLPNLKQKTIEEFFGLKDNRDDEISGKESIDFYYNYVGCNNLEIKKNMERQILLHNHDDILQLFKLLPIIRKCNVHRAANKLGFMTQGIEKITEGISWEPFTIDHIKMSSKDITVSGRYGGEPFSYIGFESFEHPYTAMFNKDNTYSATYKIETIKGNSYIDIIESGLEVNEFTDYPGFVNGCLVLKEEDIHYHELNMLAKEIVHKLMDDTVR